MRTWIWWKIYTRVKPLLSIARAEDEQKKLQEEFEKTKEELAKTEKKAQALEEQNVTLQQQKNDMFLQMQVAEEHSSEQDERIDQLLKSKQDYEEQLRELEDRIGDAEGKI